LLQRVVLLPNQVQLAQPWQARFQVTDGMPRLVKRQVTIGDLQQAQCMRALGALRLKLLRRLPIGVNGGLVAAETTVAVAEQVKEVRPVLRRPGGNTHPKGPKALLRCHGSPFCLCDVSPSSVGCIRNSPPSWCRSDRAISHTIAPKCRS
jgi:hypothetical protein